MWKPRPEDISYEHESDHLRSRTGTAIADPVFQYPTRTPKASDPTART